MMARTWASNVPTSISVTLGKAPSSLVPAIHGFRQVKAGDIGSRLVTQQSWWRDDKKINVKAVPLHSTQAGNLGCDLTTRNPEAQLVPETDTQGLC